MNRRDLLKLAALAPMAPFSAYQQRYSALQLDEVVTLTDRQTDTVVTIVPSVAGPRTVSTRTADLRSAIRRRIRPA